MLVEIGFDRLKYNENSDKIAALQTMKLGVSTLMLTQINVTDCSGQNCMLESYLLVSRLNRVQIGLGDDGIMGHFISNFLSILQVPLKIDQSRLQLVLNFIQLCVFLVKNFTSFLLFIQRSFSSSTEAIRLDFFIALNFILKTTKIFYICSQFNLIGNAKVIPLRGFHYSNANTSSNAEKKPGERMKWRKEKRKIENKCPNVWHRPIDMVASNLFSVGAQ